MRLFNVFKSAFQRSKPTNMVSPNTMQKPQTIVVFGATGKQGGSVVRALLADSQTAAKYHVKAVTRDTTKDKAKALASLGAEVVSGDLNNKDSLHAIIKGAYGVFSVTNFWEIFKPDIEETQGKTVADVCKEEGVKHLIWSSLLNITKLTNGVLSQVHHFDAKARVEEYIRSLDIPASFFLPGFYMANIPGQSFRQMPDGKWGLAMPMPEDAPIPLLDTEGDTGKFVKAMFMNEEKVLGKRVYGATAYVTPGEIVATFKELFPEAGKEAAFKSLPGEVFKGILAKTGAPEAVQEELLQNMRLCPEFGYYGGDSLDWSVGLLSEKPTTFKEFAAKSPVFADLH